MIIVRPVLWLLLGMRIRNRENLPKEGPAIIAANHNSHLDTVALMAMMPLRRLHTVHPGAAADYWEANPWITWFGKTIIGVVPVYRKGDMPAYEKIAACHDVLKRGEILIIFPEGSRGKPERIGSRMHYGLANLMAETPEAPVIPVFFAGTGKAWPAGSGYITPFICDAFIGEPLYYRNSHEDIMRRFEASLHELSKQGEFTELILEE